MLILTYPYNVPLDVFSIEIEFVRPLMSNGVIVIPVVDSLFPYDP